MTEIDRTPGGKDRTPGGKDMTPGGKDRTPGGKDFFSFVFIFCKPQFFFKFTNNLKKYIHFFCHTNTGMVET